MADSSDSASEYSDSGSDSDSSESDLDDIFGDSSDEEDFGGFTFKIPDNIVWEKDDNGRRFHSYYERKPATKFIYNNCGPTLNGLPGEGKPIDLFKTFLSDEFLEKILMWTNRWYELKKQAEPQKHRTPFHPVTDIRELKVYFALLLTMNKDVILPRYENYFRSDETKWFFEVPGFNKVMSSQRFTLLNRYVFFANPDDISRDELSNDKW